MPLKVALQMDPIQGINIDTDSSFMMALEAERRGHEVFHYLPRDLSLLNGKARAAVRTLHVERTRGAHYRLGEPTTVDLATMDVILLRQDPPFDLAYITTTHILEHVQPGTLVLNDPASVRNAPEKLLVAHFPDLAPPTLITSDKAEILAFRAEHKDIVVKPLYGNGGAGVFHLKPEDENLSSLLEMFAAASREPVIVQRYLPEVRAGDKRIILIEGRAVGAVSRMPKEGEARANFHAGGGAAKTAITEREHEICRRIGPTLRERGLVFVGIDVIGDWLTEINVTSPTCIQEINRLDGVHLERDLWDAIETRAAARPPGKPTIP